MRRPVSAEHEQALRHAEWQNERDQRYEHWRLHLLDAAAGFAAEAAAAGWRGLFDQAAARRCLWLVAVGREGEAHHVLKNHGVYTDVSIIAPTSRADDHGA